MKFFAVVTFLAFSLSSALPAPPELDPKKDLPRFPAVEAANAVSTIKVKKGFHVELAASEPLVTDPIALSIDENGRMFVVEMSDYSELRNVHPHLGHINMLEDTDGDGKYDKVTLFADDLPWPTGIICYDGGIFVAASPDIIYLKASTGTGKADIRKVIYKGFGNTRGDKLNVQALVNGFNWGLDNKIHGLSAPNGGIVTNLAEPSQKELDLQHRNFAFDPRTYLMTPEAGGGQYGLSFDSRGRKFTCSNSDHINYFMYEGRYGERNNLYAMPPAMASIAVDGGAAEVYRISPEEPWRVIRTKWRVSGVSPGMIEGGGRSAGYFTGATGITVYRGNAWPEEFLDNAFTGDAGGNLLHRKLVTPDDVGLKAERPADEQKVEFLASTDTWFRPVLSANSPDGCFYVIDMYRETIEHPWSLPEQIKKHLDLNSGNDRGRIFRVVPDGFKQPPLPHLGEATTKELVATLDNSNGWHRDTAARLLYERQDKSAKDDLDQLLKHGSRFGRLHALHALDGLGILKEGQIVTALGDADFTVRAHAIELSEKFLGNPSGKLWLKLQSMSADPDVTVRYQLAFTMGETKMPQRVKVLTEIIKTDLGSTYMQAAVFSSLSQCAAEMFRYIATDPTFRAGAGNRFLQQLVEMIGAKNDPKEVGTVINFLSSVDNASLNLGIVRALGTGLKRAGSSLAAVDKDGTMKATLAKAGKLASDESASEETRLQAIQLLTQTSFADSGWILLGLLDLNQSQAIQSAALSSVAKFNDPQVADYLTNHWTSLTPRMRSEALNVLLGRHDRAVVLLTAIENGVIHAKELTTAQIKFLRNHNGAQAEKVLGAVTASKRQEVIDAFMPALSLTGDAAHGKKIYEERCSSCHRLGGEGHALGPDLVTVKTSGKEKIMVNVLDPNREVAPQFQAFEVELKDGDSLIGIINEDANSVTVHQAFGKETVVLRSNIAKIRNQQLSLMPEGVEAGLQNQDVADLLEYITTADAGK